VSRLLILSLNYAPEPTGFAPHTTALAEHLVKVGHDVTVVTGFPFAPRWRRWPAYRGPFVRRESRSGVRVVRISHFIPRRPGHALQRILMEGTFVAAGLLVLLPRLAAGHYDVVMYVGAQPAIAWLARVAAAVWRVPYIVKITDLAAQAALDVGIVVGGSLATALERIEFSAYRHARAAITPCDAFEKALSNHGFPVEAIHMIRDSVDLKTIRPTDGGGRFRERHGIGPEEFVVLYSGSLGLKQGLFDVVGAAESLAADSPDVRWVVVGEGELRDALAKRIESAGLDDRVLLLELQPEAELSEMFAAADVLLLSQLRSVKDTVIPSKLLMYMAAGRPILAAVNAASQGAAIVSAARCGVIVAAEDPRAIAAAVLDLKQQPAARDVMARRSRAYAEQHFDRDAVVVAQQLLIERVLNGDAGRAQTAAT
jgi:colanic acid biosynthesis glycosyl transferase WcaI